MQLPAKLEAKVLAAVGALPLPQPLQAMATQGVPAGCAPSGAVQTHAAVFTGLQTQLRADFVAPGLVRTDNVREN